MKLSVSQQIAIALLVFLILAGTQYLEMGFSESYLKMMLVYYALTSIVLAITVAYTLNHISGRAKMASVIGIGLSGVGGIAFCVALFVPTSEPTVNLPIAIVVGAVAGATLFSTLTAISVFLRHLLKKENT